MSGAISGGAGSTLTKTGNGILNITGAQTYDNLATGGGAISVTNLSTALGKRTPTIIANATLNIYASQTLASLTIGDGVEVTFGDGLPFAGGPEKFGAPALVPEPGSMGLLLTGVLGTLARRPKRHGRRGEA